MRTLLFNPGPTNVSEEVREALKTRDICHREPEFTEVLPRVTRNLVAAFGGAETHSAILFVSSGTGCNEAICAAIRGKALVLNNGKYAERIYAILQRLGVPCAQLEVPHLEPIDLSLLARAVRDAPELTHLYIVHHETTTGVLAPLREIGKLAAEHGLALCVDAVSSLGGHEFDLVEDNIAFCAVSANKCLESFPGVSFVLARDEELAKLKGQSRSYYFDLHMQWSKQRQGETPFTPAVQLVFAVDRAVRELVEEGAAARVERYRRLSARMRKGLAALGLELQLLPDGLQSNILTAIRIPDGMDYWRVHDKLKERGITIYSDETTLAEGRFRVATMGHLSEDDVDWFLRNFEEVLREEGVL